MCDSWSPRTAPEYTHRCHSELAIDAGFDAQVVHKTHLCFRATDTQASVQTSDVPLIVHGHSLEVAQKGVYSDAQPLAVVVGWHGNSKTLHPETSHFRYFVLPWVLALLYNRFS